MDSFLPPQFNLGLAWAIDLSLPVILKTAQNIDNVVISPEDRAMLRSLRESRLIYISNHPSQSEPPVAYAVANVMGARFRYMAARHIFEWAGGTMGRLFQGLGAFSVIAGTADRESIKMARATLSEKDGKLVLFPEGEPTSGENDVLLPFQPGVAQLGFWGMEDAVKNDEDADILILPAFVKYVISNDRETVRKDLESSIRVLAKKLKIDPGEKNLLRQFLSVGRCLLEKEEAAYSIPMASRNDWDYRIGRIRHAILDGVADRLKIHGYDTRADAIVKLRHLLSIIDMVTVGFQDPRLPQVAKPEIEWARKECLKAYDFVVMKRDYLTSYPTPERFYEFLGRYESRVYGTSKPRPRVAHVRFAKPFSIREYYDRYKSDKRKAVETLTARLREDMERLLAQSADLSKPLVTPNEIGEPAVV